MEDIGVGYFYSYLNLVSRPMVHEEELGSVFFSA